MYRRLILWLAGAASILVMTGTGGAQPVCPDECAGSAVHWEMTAGDRAPVPGVEGYPIDSLTVVAHEVLRTLQREGYYNAAIEKIDTTAAAEGVRVIFRVDRGRQTVVDRVTVTGISEADSTVVGQLVDTAPGEVARADRLEADIDRILRHYASIGYPLAQVEVRKLSMDDGSSRLTVQLHVKEGPAVVLDGIELSGARRLRPAYVERLLGLSSGEPLAGYDPDAIRRRLEATGLFTFVGEPALSMTGSRRALLNIPVEEAPPGQFDFVLGYKPPSGGTPGQLVGNGFIDLENLFGGGRRFHFELDRMSGQVSEVQAGVELPFTGGSPLRTELQFAGYQQDSTYGSRALRTTLGYRLDGGLEFSVAGQWKVTRPGVYGTEQEISPSTLWSGGIGLQYRQLDHHVNPRDGWLFELALHHGRKQRRDTAAVIRQQRLESRVRTFLPTFEQQLVVAGYDARFLQSPSYDRTDLYRIGGTKSLRGYEEDQFLVRLAARGLLEYRLQIDRQSYGFLFTDLGYLARPSYGSVDRTRWWRWGYGVGAQVETNVGLVKLSYALTPRAGIAGGRVHIGMSLAL